MKGNAVARIGAFFENLNEVVYIADARDHELLFLNGIGRKVLGLGSPGEFAGKKCYEVLHGFSAPCSMCTTPKLKVGEFYEWTYFNAKAGRYYSLKDTLVEVEGRTLRVEIALDIDAQLKRGEAIREIAFNEGVINNALELALNEDDPDRSIGLMLQHLGEQLEGDRVYIFEDNGDGTFDNTYEWCRDGVEPQINNLKRIPYEGVIEIWYNEFDMHNNILIHDLELYKEVSLPMYEILKPQDIQSLVVGPLNIHNRRIGFYGIDNPPYRNIENISTLYLVLGRFIAALLRHRDNVRKMEAFSYADQMTGVSNRHALNLFLERTARSLSRGFIFCDINGLKKMNDEQGHDAGDLLIMRTVMLLKSCFSARTIFRMGGDEFLCICVGESEDMLARREEELRDLFRKGGVSVAVGSVWVPNGEESFNSLFRRVDAQMYEDKRRHYGERRQRPDGPDGGSGPRHPPSPGRTAGDEGPAD